MIQTAAIVVIAVCVLVVLALIGGIAWLVHQIDGMDLFDPWK